MLNLKIDLHLSTFVAPTIFIVHFSKFRSSHVEVFCKKGVIINFVKFTGKHLCQRLFFNNVSGLRPATLLKKESLIQVFSHEFCEISKNSFFLQNTSGGCYCKLHIVSLLVFSKFSTTLAIAWKVENIFFFLNDCLKLNQSNKKVANLLTKILQQELCDCWKNLKIRVNLINILSGK